ncbi:NAD(P)H-dependent oxidoreductase [Shimazuella kribbensis]|uniref:NAD(P)H-dependent oxidoreductase n=1 Tax=Shimazuella kribbensis TaxID=139808 RepID=UPI000426490A|nr:NAD(P)H-dependent oxidoreductase [Shimazuella kribbensis]
MKTIVIVAHPNLKESRANKTFIDSLSEQSHIDIHNLYQKYPDWNIDVEREHQLLLEYQRIVLLFPFYWYSSPPLLKKWFDDVMVYGWAFGPGGDHLKGKEFIIATTTGGKRKEYQAGGRNWFTISELLRPMQTTIQRCNGTFLPSFVMYNANLADEAQLTIEAGKFLNHIKSPLEAFDM